MPTGTANAIMSCKYWLGFEEPTQQDIRLEDGLDEERLKRNMTVDLDEDS